VTTEATSRRRVSARSLTAIESSGDGARPSGHAIHGRGPPLVVAIEIISFLSRSLSHSVRLFANMLAGHITLKVFAGFVALLGTSRGTIGWIGGMLPLALTVALTALELLVAFLQAYVFAILTCIYLNDAIHAGH
jgi:F-type H+-transporting ATPase subunit a